MNVKALLHRNKAWRLGNKAHEESLQAAHQTGDHENGARISAKARSLHQRAIKEIELAIALEPDDPDDYFSLYWNLSQLGETDRAVEACRKALEIDPDHADARRGLAYHYRLESCRHGDKADELDRKARAEHTDQDDPLPMTPEARHMYEQAIGAIKCAIELEPEIGNSYYTLYWNLSKMGEIEEAEAALQKVLELDPDHASAKSVLARRYRDDAYRLGNAAKVATEQARAERMGSGCAMPIAPKAKRLHEEAVEAIQLAIELTPDDADAYYTLYWNQAYLRQYDEGLQACQRALDIDPNHRKARQGLAWSYQRLGKFEQALVEYRQLLANGAKAASIWQEIGTCLLMTDRGDERIPHFEAAVAVHPKNKKLLRGLYLAYAAKERWADALPLAEKVVALGGDHNAYIAVASAYEALGHHEEARKALEAAVEHAGGSVDPLIRLSKWHERHGDAERALSFLDQASSKEMTDSMKLYAIGNAFEAFGHLEKALDVFERAYTLEPGMPFLAAKVAGIYETLGNDSKAKEYYILAIQSTRRFCDEHESEMAALKAENSEGHPLQPHRIFVDLHHEMAKYLIKIGDLEALNVELDYLDQYAPDLAEDVRTLLE